MAPLDRRGVELPEAGPASEIMQSGSVEDYSMNDSIIACALCAAFSSVAQPSVAERSFASSQSYLPSASSQADSAGFAGPKGSAAEICDVRTAARIECRPGVAHGSITYSVLILRPPHEQEHGPGPNGMLLEFRRYK